MKKLLVSAALMATALGVGLAVVPASAQAEATNWYVCKYVNKPGPLEVIQTGQNPIFVDENAITAQTGLPDVHIGDQFADAQTLSIVVAGPEAPPGVQPGPGIEICAVSTSTTTPPPTSTTPPPVTTTPPPATTTPPPASTTTPPPPVTTQPPTGGGNPPPNQGPPQNQPPPKDLNPPPTLAFTGPEAALPLGALAVALATAGSGLMWVSRRRRYSTPPRSDL